MKRARMLRVAVATVLCPVLVASCTTKGRPRTAGTTMPPPPPPVTTASSTAAPAPPVPVIAPPGVTSDADMIQRAAIDNAAEIRLATAALQRATNERVRLFAEQMIREHGQASAELARIAQSLGVTLPGTPDPGHDAPMTYLATMTGRPFEIAFLEHMIADHAKEIAMFERIASTAADPALRAGAQRMIPMLRQHYAVVNDLHVQIARVPAAGAPAASPPLAPTRPPGN